MKTGRPVTWVFIVMFFSIVGVAAYVIVELLPEWTNSRSGVQMRRRLSKLADPDRNLKSASQRLAVADTVQNTILLAAECLAKEKYTEAEELYRRAMRGLHADDPVLLYGLARARFGLGNFAGTIEALDLLKEKHPEQTSGDGHLLYARAKEQLGYYAGPEPACRLGAMLKERGRTDEAQALFQKVINQSRIAGRHYNSIHREWVEMARREA
jgi:hypothetical protein